MLLRVFVTVRDDSREKATTIDSSSFAESLESINVSCSLLSDLYLETPVSIAGTPSTSIRNVFIVLRYLLEECESCLQKSIDEEIG